MFEEFGEMFGWRTNYSLAEMAAVNGDADSMVVCLERMTARIIPELLEREPNTNWNLRAGRAFFNLAKTLDEKQEFCRNGARRSLNCSFQYYNLAGIKPMLMGLSREEINDYRNNPESGVSLKELELADN